MAKYHKEPTACEDCKYWALTPERHNDIKVGQCRRFPPSLVSTHLTKAGPLAMFPLTLAFQLCGEFSVSSPSTALRS